MTVVVGPRESRARGPPKPTGGLCEVITYLCHPSGRIIRKLQEVKPIWEDSREQVSAGAPHVTTIVAAGALHHEGGASGVFQLGCVHPGVCTNTWRARDENPPSWCWGPGREHSGSYSGYWCPSWTWTWLTTAGRHLQIGSKLVQPKTGNCSPTYTIVG